MGYKLKQWVVEDSRDGSVWKEKAKSRQRLEKRLGEELEYVTILGTVKSLTRSRQAREELKERFDDSSRKAVAQVAHQMLESLQNNA